MKWLLYITYIPAIMWMIVIAGFSGTGGEESSGLSLRVTEGIVDVIDTINVSGTFSEEEHSELVDMLHTPVRKAAHMTEYAVLYILIFIPTLLTLKGMNNRRRMIAALIVCVVYASVDEIHQLFVEGREGKFTDVIIDIVGSLLGLVFVFCINKFANRKIICECEQ